MKKARVIFPNQLFKEVKSYAKEVPIFLIEEQLFFNQYAFHKQKLSFHRASMKCYADYLVKNGYKTTYIDCINPLSDIRMLLEDLIEDGVGELYVMNPTDNWLEQRIAQFSNRICIVEEENRLFINSRQELSSFFSSSKKKFFQTSFYKEQRRKRNILMDEDAPLGGKWTYDIDNRKKYPRGKIPPKITYPKTNKYIEEAHLYVQKYFPNNPGELSSQPLYPINFEESEQWMEQFFNERFYDFGIYEDAIVAERHFLHHSVLSPMLNVGLLMPMQVVDGAIEFAMKNNIPLNSLEGFVRQILGWREFIRGVYEVKGSRERTTNFWEHTRKIPSSFYEGTTGIAPIDTTIKKILKTGYAHHIERLMVLGNFMLLCEFDPDEVYQWFMELFIDAYDWVMVPNVYGMSLFADGGLFATKPYISSSNYIKKMSNYPNGDWQEIWDALFWRFMDKHRSFLSKNSRLKMLLSNLDKMDQDKRGRRFLLAEEFLDNLHRPNKNIQTMLL